MSKKRLLWRLYPSYLIIIALSLAAIAIYASRSIRNIDTQNESEKLLITVRLLADTAEQPLTAGDTNTLDAEIKKAATASGHRITIILPDGTVAADSEENPLKMENHAGRPEVQQAMGETVGISQRFSATLGKAMLYVAIPIKHNNNIIAVIRAATPLVRLKETLRPIYMHLILVGCVTAAAAAVLSLLLARTISTPLRQVTKGALRFADGELDFRMSVPDSREFAPLAETLNKMAASLNERIHTIIAQRNELEAVLSSMAEGVLVVDSEQQIITINKAGASLLGVDVSITVGHHIQEVIYSPEFHQLVVDVLKTAQPLEKDIAVHKDKKRYLQVHAAPLDKSQGKGAVIVLNDMTRVYQLENLRKEFVSNVSHELKTPITSIKGFVETLLDGAFENPVECKQFLGIIAKHTSRLNAIIEDLLSLSRVEQESENRHLVTEIGSIKDVLITAVAACQSKAAEKQIQITIDCDPKLTAQINAPLLEQAIINLVDNAIKYSDAQKHIQIQARRNNGEVIISVTDEGFGIAPEHLPRIFERFYVADKARSRKLGGTGLGLSIVKHIVSAHGGKVGVESQHGKGSTFTILLPAN